MFRASMQQGAGETSLLGASDLDVDADQFARTSLSILTCL
jgi:hypothetical protein